MWIGIKDNDRVMVARCAFCNNEDVEFKDVDPKEKVSIISNFNP
jgi:hypothetical protein